MLACACHLAAVTAPTAGRESGGASAAGASPAVTATSSGAVAGVKRELPSEGTAGAVGGRTVGDRVGAVGGGGSSEGGSNSVGAEFLGSAALFQDIVLRYGPALSHALHASDSSAGSLSC